MATYKFTSTMAGFESKQNACTLIVLILMGTKVSSSTLGCIHGYKSSLMYCVFLLFLYENVRFIGIHVFFLWWL